MWMALTPVPDGAARSIAQPAIVNGGPSVALFAGRSIAIAGALVAPVCVTGNVCPAIVSVPDRGVVVGLAEAE
jgi:hypothetical protein